MNRITSCADLSPHNGDSSEEYRTHQTRKVMTSKESWTSCPDGTLQSICNRQQRKVAREQMTRRAMLTGAGGSIASLVLILAAQRSEASLCCKDIHRLADCYVNRRLNDSLTAAVDQHRKACGGCDRMLQKLMEDAAPA